MLAIGSLVGFGLDSLLSYYDLDYQLNAGDPNSNPNKSSIDNFKYGGGKPPKNDSNLSVYHPQKDETESGGLPQSTSMNSIKSDVSYSEQDSHEAAKADKQNFSNVVNNNHSEATKLYNNV